KADYVFTTLDPPDTTFVTAFAINDVGQIVGRYADASGVNHGFLLSGGSFLTLDPPGSTDTAAFGINASGQIVGRYVAGGHQHHPRPARLDLDLGPGDQQLWADRGTVR